MPPKKLVGWKPTWLDESGKSAGPSTTPQSAQQQVEPSTASRLDIHVQMQELGSEEQIVRHFNQPTGLYGELTDDQKSEEITMYRYSISNQVLNCWADGDLSTYCFTRRKWGDRIAVKFYVLKDLSKEEAAKISRKVDALLSMPRYTNVFTPIFQVYNERVKSVILCYPPFDLHLEDWLESNRDQDTLQNAGQNLLRPVWINFIRDTLSCIEPIDKMAISNFGRLSSYVWKEKSKCIKIIVFPCENQTFGVDKVLLDFADLLKNKIRSRWLHPELQFELDTFVTFLKVWPTRPEGIRQFWVNLANNPLLQDYDGISALVRMTWRKSLSPDQESELTLNITYPASWKHVVINDPVMKQMFTNGAYSDDPAGLFTFITDMAAHYTENYRKRRFRDPNDEKHPVSLIKDTYHCVIGQIYMLSKKTKWLQ